MPVRLGLDPELVASDEEKDREIREAIDKYVRGIFPTEKFWALMVERGYVKAGALARWMRNRDE